ncbi:MAG: hypothetical protein ACFFCQ_18320 [Promethearchaeota archaeon]
MQSPLQMAIDTLDIIIVILTYLWIGFLVSFAADWEQILFIGILLLFLNLLPEELSYIFIIGFFVDFLDEDFAFQIFLVLLGLWLIFLGINIVLRIINYYSSPTN